MINNTAKNRKLHQFTRTIITAKIHRIALFKKTLHHFTYLPGQTFTNILRIL